MKTLIVTLIQQLNHANKTLNENDDDAFVDNIAVMTLQDAGLSKLTYRFAYNFWNCFFQRSAVCSQTRIDVDFNQPYLQNVALEISFSV